MCHYKSCSWSVTYQPMNGSYSLDLLPTKSVEQSHSEYSQLILGLSVSKELAQSFIEVTKGLNFAILRRIQEQKCYFTAVAELSYGGECAKLKIVKVRFGVSADGKSNQ